MAPKAKVEQSRVDALRARVEQEVADALRERKADEMTAKIINDVNANQARLGAPPVEQSEIAKLRAQLLAGAPMLNFDIAPPPGFVPPPIANTQQDVDMAFAQAVGGQVYIGVDGDMSGPVAQAIAGRANENEENWTREGLQQAASSNEAENAEVE